MTNARHWSEQLKALGACCAKAMDWAATMPDPQTAWAKCKHPDWMLWVVERLCSKFGSDGHRRVVLATCACVRIVLPSVPHGEERPRKAIELAEAWARHKQDVTLMMVCKAGNAAYDVGSAIFTTSTAAVAACPVYAAVIACPAYAAAGAAGIAYADAVKIASLAAAYMGPSDFNARCLRIIRRMLPDVPEWFEEHRKTGAINR